MKNRLLTRIAIMTSGFLVAAAAGAAEPPAPSITPDNLPAYYQQLKAKLTYPLAWSPAVKDLDAWHKAGRAKLEEALIVPADHTAFEPQVVDEIDRGSYVARKVVFNLTAEARVTGLLLVPKGKGPFPAALLLHDHGSKFDIGKEKLIEPWGDDAKLASAQAWSKKYFSDRFVGDEMAKRGYAVLAVDAFGWGDRGKFTYDIQQAVASNMFNLGSSLAGQMAREDQRAVEFLASLPDVDKKRVAAVGFSMGAFRAWQVAALSDAVKATVAVCWMATTDGLMVPGNNQLRGQSAWQMLHPGLLRWMDFPDVASLGAPKPTLFIDGSKDPLFPADSVQAAYAKMRQVWAAHKAENVFDARIWPDVGHVFVKDEQDFVFDWLDKQFKPGA